MIKIQVPTKFIFTYRFPLRIHTLYLPMSWFFSRSYFRQFLDLRKIPITAKVMVLKVLSWKRKCTKIFNLRQNSLLHTVSSFEYRLYIFRRFDSSQDLLFGIFWIIEKFQSQPKLSRFKVYRSKRQLINENSTTSNCQYARPITKCTCDMIARYLSDVLVITAYYNH